MNEDDFVYLHARGQSALKRSKAKCLHLKQNLNSVLNATTYTQVAQNLTALVEYRYTT